MAADGSVLAPWKPSKTDLWDRRKVGHLLRRAAFGGSPEQIEAALSGGVEATVASLLKPKPSAADAVLDGIEKTIRNRKNTDAYAAWWLQRMVQTGDPLRQRAALLWHGHFATSDAKVESADLMAEQYQLFHEHGLGDLRVLARAVTRDCAMLRFLDGNRNRKDHPNENFAREIFELFLLGIGNYTEDDIHEAARAFTGFREEEGKFVFRPDLHDTGAKTIFGKSGKYGGDDVVALCFERDASATFLARRLTSAFFAPDLGPELDQALGKELRAVDFHAGRFLERLFRSRLFYEPKYYRSIVRSPVDYCVGTLRSLGESASAEELHERLTKMGQRLFVPPGVQGWSGGAAWLTSARMVARNRFASDLAKRAPEGEWKTRVELLLDGEVADRVKATLQGKSSRDQLHCILMLPESHVA